MQVPIKTQFAKSLIWVFIGLGLLSFPIWGTLLLAYINCGSNYLGPCSFYEIQAFVAFIFTGIVGLFFGFPSLVYALLLLGKSLREYFRDRS